MIGPLKTSVMRGGGSAGGGGNPELVSGGDFSSDVGWTLIGGASISGGRVTFPSFGNCDAYTTATSTITAGDYIYEFDVITADGGTVIVRVGGSFLGQTIESTPGHYSGTITSTGSAQTVGLRTSDSGGTFDNFSVKKK